MANKVLLTFLGADVIFLLTGGLLIGFALISESAMRSTPTTGNVASHVLLNQCPLTATVVNAVLVFVTFLLSLPVFILPSNRKWLNIHGWLVVFCATFTLILGLVIWFDTLKTRANLASLWAQESPLVQSLLQQRFQCCGYLNDQSPPFAQDSTCTTQLVATQRGGCVGPFSNFANQYLDVIFTALFGVVGVDVILLLCVAMVLKDRQEQARYRHIDEKIGSI